MTVKSAATFSLRNISREFMTGAVTGAAMLLFIGTGGTVLVKALANLHGYAVGDLLLVYVAETIAAIAPGASLLARLGADEFTCAFVFDSAHKNVADRIAERMVAGLALPFRSNGVEIHMSVSIGIARWPRN